MIKHTSLVSFNLRTWFATLTLGIVLLILAQDSSLLLNITGILFGVTLILYCPLKIGDRVEMSTLTRTEVGIVKSITLGYTLLKTDDSSEIVVPNSVMASQISIKLSQKVNHKIDAT